MGIATMQSAMKVGLVFAMCIAMTVAVTTEDSEVTQLNDAAEPATTEQGEANLDSKTQVPPSVGSKPAKVLHSQDAKTKSGDEPFLTLQDHEADSAAAGSRRRMSSRRRGASSRRRMSSRRRR